MENYIIKKYKLRNRISTIVLSILVIVLLSALFTPNIYAKYKSSSSMKDNARVAKFGTLSFVEYLSDGTTKVVGNESVIDTVDVTAGVDIPKKINLQFSGNEIAVYLFLVVEATGWTLNNDYSNTQNALSIKNSNNDDIIYWNLSNKWNYIKTETIKENTNRFIFYSEVSKNTPFDETVMNSLNVNAIDLEDINLLQTAGYDLTLKTYAISKIHDDPLEAWSYVTNG